jgi:hypothetical protein
MARQAATNGCRQGAGAVVEGLLFTSGAIISGSLHPSLSALFFSYCSDMLRHKTQDLKIFDGFAKTAQPPLARPATH